jgi:hypothetical protein
MGIERVNQSPLTQRLGNDTVYGRATSSDGTVTITTNTTLNADAHYYNLQVNSGVFLNTNGFRLFVKNNLVNNGVIGIGSLSGATVGEPSSVSSGTTSGLSSSTAITYSIGGVGGGGTAPSATQLPESYRSHIESLINGVVILPDGTTKTILGGSSGTTGSSGSTAPVYVPASWPGISGATGSNGGYSPNASSVNSPGGRGNTGYPGTKTGATVGPGGAGGAGGSGGGVVLVAAKNISGSGKFISIGKSGSTGSAGTDGNPGANGPGATAYTSTTQRGTSGVDLVDGHQAPSITHANPNGSAAHPHPSGHANQPHPSGTHPSGVHPYTHPSGHTPNHHHVTHVGRVYHSHSHNVDMGKGAIAGNHTGSKHFGDTAGHNHHYWTDANYHPGENRNQNHSHNPGSFHHDTYGHTHEAKYDANIHHNPNVGPLTPYQAYQPYAFLHTPTTTVARWSNHPSGHANSPHPSGTHPSGVHPYTHPSGVHHYTHHVAPSHFLGGAGGSGGTGAPKVTGGTGKRGGAGGGGGVIVITDTTPTGSITYDTRSGLTADSDNYAATSGYTYIVLNN